MDIKNGRKMRECKLILNNGDIIGYKILQTNQIFYHINEKYLYIWTNKTLTDLFQLALDTIHSKKNIKM